MRYIRLSKLDLINCVRFSWFEIFIKNKKKSKHIILSKRELKEKTKTGRKRTMYALKKTMKDFGII